MSEARELADVCIVGAGIAGAILAYELGRRGIRVVVLEAGSKYDKQDKYYRMEKYLKGEDPWSWVNSERDRYTNAGEINYPLNSLRIKAVGGSTLHWAAVCPRLHETDFRMKSLYGLGEDWPISYEEIEPYYGKAEIALGVSGMADNPFASRRSTAYPLPPFPFSYANQILKKGCDKLGITMHHAPLAKNSIPYQSRPACQAFSTCHPVCPIEAQYNAEVHIRLAEATGRVKVIADANVVQLNLASSGKVGSVTYAKLDKSEHEQRARVFILAAHAVETARLLLFSKPRGFSHGLANSSGVVGKYFMEHPFTGVRGRLKQQLFPFRIGFHAAESHQFCATKSRDTIGAFKLDFQSSGGPLPRTIVQESGNWGAALKKEIQESFGRDGQIGIMLEQLPDPKNSITLDASVKDYFGNPVPRLTFFVSNYEKNSIKTAISKVGEIFEALGATEIDGNPDYIAWSAHHMGTCRMGNNPETSVVNRNLKAHDVENLLIAGSSVFVTGGAVNPTLTIAALSFRLADHILAGAGYL